jgi:hypothetical protein
MKETHHQKIMTSCKIPWMLTVSIWLLGSCVSMAPINSSFESAKTLGKGQIECLGTYSSYYLNTEDEYQVRGKANNNFGFRLGYGISNRLDLKFKYERIIPVNQDDKELIKGVDYFALTPRFAIVKNMLSGAMDVYFYVPKGEGISGASFFISPRFAFTYPSGKNFDLTLSTKVDIYPTAFNDETYLWGLNLGCGVSSDLEKWSFRPEIGIISDISHDTWYSWGVAFIVKFNTRKPTNPQ